MSRSASDVKEKILQAFQGTLRPGDADLVIDNGYDPECKEVRTAFKGKDWKSISPGMVRDHAEALPLLTPTAFRHYLPAYMIACIDAHGEIDVALDSVIFNLTPPKEANSWQRDFFQTRAEGFTDLQAEAIRSLLEFLDESDRDGWAGEGIERPEDRFGPAIAFWSARGLGR